MKAFLEWSTGHLNQAGIDSPRMEAEVLLARALQLCREELYRRPERILSEAEKSISRDLIDRRVRREPVAYILGARSSGPLIFKLHRTSSFLVRKLKCLLKPYFH